ncbi:sugar ABC transporter permease [Ferrovibrio terrae]|uniref:Sugar ABC transporter permease n=1 Tax=Ferrovibrio terrae TaxID=2594003 RepID=A0A516GWU0_9PROT|nr:sugar ABC transporter permease [Ferrovibrio terrae]QDO96011.1 sugar ABC transporter permease [Ferrovibrio terrae]
MVSLAQDVAPSRRSGRMSAEATWGLIMLIPYIAIFLTFVLYPVGYGLYLGTEIKAYRRIFDDPIFLRTLANTVIFLGLAVNIKLMLALLLSGFFVHERRWIRWLSFIFILPWAIPSIPTILSFRWMLNAEWGMINSLIFQFTFQDGPGWLLDRVYGLGSIITIHIWKYLPFWTLILVAARLTISKDLYESADVDGASGLQKFLYITFPGVRNMYITSTLLSTIWTLGDFNSIYLLTGGGPADSTQVLATLGIRYAFGMSEVRSGVATIIVALPFMVPIVVLMVKRLRGEDR